MKVDSRDDDDDDDDDDFKSIRNKKIYDKNAIIVIRK